MLYQEILAISLYIVILLTIGFFSYRKNLTSSEFIIGGRSMNFWVTALAAHASDMSSWIFMAYPAALYSAGLFNIWAAIGLTLFMYLNWQFIAPKIRTKSEEYSCVTFSSFFEAKYSDSSGLIRIFTAMMLFIFYTIYISAGLVGLGLLIETLFPISYDLGILFGLCIVVPYLFIGGYLTLAWTDLFQGIFLLIAISLVPLYILPQIGGFDAILQTGHEIGYNFNMTPSNTFQGWLGALFMMVSWGLGYFGQPHIITKFMGIKHVEDTYKAKYLGISWQIIALGFATLIGLISIVLFKGGINDSQLIFIRMTEQHFPPFLASFILCAILGVTITTMDSQILVLASSIAEDFYKRIFKKNASSKELLLVSRISIFIIAVIAYIIASGKNQTIFELVSYAWFGLGASFGPLLIFSLYSNKINKYGAWASVITGGLTAGTWPLIDHYLNFNIPTLIPGFIVSSLCMIITSMLTKHIHEVK